VAEQRVVARSAMSRAAQGRDWATPRASPHRARTRVATTRRIGGRVARVSPRRTSDWTTIVSSTGRDRPVSLRVRRLASGARERALFVERRRPGRYRQDVDVAGRPEAAEDGRPVKVRSEHAVTQHRPDGVDDALSLVLRRVHPQLLFIGIPGWLCYTILSPARLYGGRRRDTVRPIEPSAAQHPLSRRLPAAAFCLG